ncbi:MAG: tryptophan--tRNA ligase [Candidatus Paceibacterota bacterium]
MSEEKKIQSIVSGIQPSGLPHIGNYFGAMARHIEMQTDYDKVFLFIAEYHALTSTQDKETLRQNIYDLAVDYLALGLDPEQVIFYRQKDVPELFELTWILNCLTSMSLLERAHAFKDKSAQGISPSIGLFDYPVLQAADILITGADAVPVGEDQRQHIEYTREIARNFNNTYGEVFNEPVELIEEAAGTILGIDGQKMSKSYGNDIPLFADDETLEKQVMAIETDSQPVEAKKDFEDDLVFSFHKLFTSEPQLSQVRAGYEEGGLGYGESKQILLKNLQSFVAPLREKRVEIAKDEQYVKDVLEAGAEKIRPQAEAKLAQVREAVGLNL